MSKLDLKKQQRSLYAPSAKQPAIVEVPPMQFLMIDGAGDPNVAEAYRASIEALYALSYTLKFTSKLELGIDYIVMPLEGLWWVDDPSTQSMEDKSSWQWTSMIRQPDHITPDQVATAIEDVRRKRDPDSLDLVRLETLDEGLVVQIMHMGRYSEEGPTIERIHQFAFDSGYRLRGKHHEIYLSDPKRTAPERMKTVVRHPVEPAR